MVSDRTVPADSREVLSEIDIDVGESLAGTRLDHFISLQFPQISRSIINASIRNLTITVAGAYKKSSYRLKAGEKVTGTITVVREPDLLPEHIEFPVLFEDPWLMILSKPPGLVVHPGSGNKSGTLVNGLLYYYREIENVGDSLRPGIVHRLDKDTSGIMVVAKTEQCHREMVDIFKDHRLEKEYLAVVSGVPRETEGRIVTSIGRHPIQRQKMAVREIGGKHAATNWKLLASLDDGCSLLKVVIETGRTHQIRVHMAHMGNPVAGDALYGRASRGRIFPRQMLHAWRLSFTHPINSSEVDLTAPLWPDFKDSLVELGGDDILAKL